MVFLADTNVLLRFADRTHPVHPIIRAALRKLRTNGHRVCATPQNFVEFWNVATRPTERNGFGAHIGFEMKRVITSRRNLAVIIFKL